MTLRKMQIYRKIALFLVFALVYQIVFPLAAYALTSGPTQPEVQSFEPVGASEMVDLFSGDFSYNIPLFEIPGPNGGYPINLFYHSVTNADEEASMVGLGWNIGVGHINRQLRGLPDDFNGDDVKRKTSMKDNITKGIGVAANFEFFGADFKKGFGVSAGLGFKLIHNNYKGIGYSFSPNVAIVAASGSSERSSKLTAGFGVDFNSLDGVSASPSVSYSLTSAGADGQYLTEKGTTIGFGVNMSSRGGWNMGLDVSSSSSKRKMTAVTRGAFSEKLGGNIPGTEKTTIELGPPDTRRGSSIGVSASDIVPENESFTPQVSVPYIGENISVAVKGGFGLWGGFLSASVSGFWNRHRIANKDWVSADAYGYLYSQNAHKNALMDFGREKDNSIIDNQPNLSIPYSSPDILSVNGHGIGGTFRPFRSDVGTYFDQQTESKSYGGTVGVEIVPHFGLDLSGNYSTSASKNPSVLASLPFNFTQQTANSTHEPYYFKHAGEMTAEVGPNVDGYIDKNNPVFLAKNTSGDKFALSTTVNKSDGSSLSIGDGKRTARKPRNNNIQPITNGKLLQTDNTEILDEYKIKYYDQSVTQPSSITPTYYSSPGTTYKNLTRNSAKPDQVAGYTVLNDGGVRWNYGLPAKNLVQREVMVSVSKSASACSVVEPIPLKATGTDGSVNDIDPKITTPASGREEYLNITETPEYVHSYLLTSILGSDYINLPDAPGEVDMPGKKDEGFWARIEYVKTNSDTNSYKWRTPFAGANYLPGHRTVGTDDKGTFMYGEREQYYPAKIISRTHTAEFYYSQRSDARGAKYCVQNTATVEDYSYKLDSIKLYSNYDLEKSPSDRGKPIKTIVFEYNTSGNAYLLCPCAENSSAGKLTLSAVYFKYENNNRGALNKYKFEYFGQSTPYTYRYNKYAFDRWGVYRWDWTTVPTTCGNGTAASICANTNFPYVNQDNSTTAVGKLNSDASAWHLKKITLPSGANIELTLERDDYAYVQDRVATQMFNIAGFGNTDGTPGGLNNGTISNDTIGMNSNFQITNDKDQNRLKVYFKLETPAPAGSTVAERQKILGRYFDDLYEESGNDKGIQLYYKIRAGLIPNTTVQNYEDISGYAYANKADTGWVTPSAGQPWTHAYIRLKPLDLKVKDSYYFHPMLLNNWQYLKVNLPDQMFSYGGGTSTGNVESQVRSLGSYFAEFWSIFTGYYSYCKNNNYGINVDLANSYIRLESPDRIKYGDGIRVKSIRMDTGWTDEQTPSYGLFYLYDTDEKEYNPATGDYELTGRKISSGVATNEPSVGSDECALKYVKSYKEELKYRQDQYRFFEYPINESYYPGASVGYSKVTVMSGPSYYAKLKLENPGATDITMMNYVWFNTQAPPAGSALSGATVHEFYTAKDFPVITKETELNNENRRRKQNLIVPIPLIGTVTTTKYTGTQGYSIELNNMHGKLKQVTNYAQDVNGKLVADPVSYVKYEYKSQEEVYTLGNKTRKRKTLDNSVYVLSGLRDPATVNQAKWELAEMGVDRELFFDMRESTSEGFNIGVNTNVDFLFLIFVTIPVPSFWVNMTTSSSSVKTAVSNKIIYKTGILSATEAKDGQSIVRTRNVYYDKYDGSPLLTVTENNFDKETYNLNVPAHFVYDGMGPAYENTGMEFRGTAKLDGSKLYLDLNTLTANSGSVKERDEFVVYNDYNNSGSFKVDNTGTVIGKGIFTTKCGNKMYLGLISGSLTDGQNYRFYIARSGKRNLQSTNIGNVIALGDPTKYNRVTTPPNISTEFTNKASLLPYPAGTPGTSYVDVNYVYQDSVLSARATTYSDRWNGYIPGMWCTSDGLAMKSNAVGVEQSIYPNTIGIWYPSANYVYVKDREDNKTGAEFSKNGIANNVPLFNWSNAFFPYSPATQNWKKTEDIMRYSSNGSPVESKDALGNYSSSLYGYKNNLPILVASNASNYEVGYEGFEEFVIGTSNTEIPFTTYDPDPEKRIRLINGNFRFGNFQDCQNGTSHYKTNQVLNFNILSGSNISATYSAKFLIDRPYSASDNSTIYNTSGASIILLLEDGLGNKYPLTGTLSTLTAPFSSGTSGLPHPSYENKTWLTIDNIAAASGNTCTLPSTTTYLKGKLSIGRVLDLGGTGTEGGILSNKYAHTGKNSMKVANAGMAVIKQELFKLAPGKDYVFSAWVRSPGNTGRTYSNVSLQLYAFDGTANQAIGSAVNPSGPIIDGWQKVEFAFTYPTFSPPTTSPQYLLIGFQGDVTNGIYYDDLRIFPKLGNMQSYVYNPSNYRLTELLDNNNYFTRYIYNSEGNLIMTKKETLEGVKTIQESGYYLKPN